MCNHRWTIGIKSGLAVMMPFILAQCLATAQSTVSLPDVIGRFGYRYLNPSVMNLPLGSLVVPGREAQSVTLGAEFKRALGKVVVSTKTIEIGEAVQIGTVGDFAQSLSAAPSDLSSALQRCLGAGVSIVQLREEKLTVPSGNDGSGSRLFSRIATLAKIQEADLKNYVVVTSVLRPAVKVDGCTDTSARLIIEKAEDSLAVGYLAGVDANTLAIEGNDKRLSILQLFELDKLADDRVLRIGGIQTVPPHARIGWIDWMTVRGQNKDTIPDTAFKWLGDAPIGEYGFWTGRFFFRLEANGKVATLQQDFTTSDRGRTITLSVQR